MGARKELWLPNLKIVITDANHTHVIRQVFFCLSAATLKIGRHIIKIQGYAVKPGTILFAYHVVSIIRSHYVAV